MAKIATVAIAAASAVSATSAFGKLDAKLDHSNAPTINAPKRASFEEFLRNDAKVPIGGGEYGPYSFEGREAILGIVRRIDKIIGSEEIQKLIREGKTPSAEEIIKLTMPDSILAVAGGAQWGKTILELNLAAYLTSQRFYNCGMFLPSDDLVQGIVDTKLRPDVIDQIPWFAEMTQIGKAVNKSGKTANRKGAFLVTDGKHRSNGMVLGLQKIPTSFTFDVTLQDEVDDIPEKNAKYVKGRRTSSKLRLDIRIGTQRVNGRGQNKVWKSGSQGVVVLAPVSAAILAETSPSDELTDISGKDLLNPEELFPGVIRCQMGDDPSVNDPKLTWGGDFKRDGDDQVIASHHPENSYYLAHPETGEPLNRRHPLWHHRAPAKFEQRNFTYRAAQFGFDAIGLSQIVNQFQLAVADPDEMIVFRCDVLALPQSTAQAITPAIMERSRTVEPYDMRISAAGTLPRFAGLDTGDKCWFYVREREEASRKRLNYATSIPAGDLMKRVPSLFESLGITALFLDQRPLVSEARGLAMRINGLDMLAHWPQVPEGDSWITLPGGLSWDGRNKRWIGLKCAVVRFDKKRIGMGIEHGFDVFEQDNITKFVPLINCNRFETIDRVVREYLTPSEGVTDIANGRIRELPAMLTPRIESSPAILKTVEEHTISGSEREKEKDGTLGDYVDGIPNHLLLADGYSALAENEVGGIHKSLAPTAGRIQKSESAAHGRSMEGVL